MTSRRFPGEEEELIVPSSKDSVLMSQEEIMKAVKNATPRQSETENFHRIAGFGIGMASLLMENVLSYPFIIFRRQCQVNHQAHRYHLQPFSVIQVIVRLQRQHGFVTMWKGISSAFVVQGIGLGSETILGEVTPLPKEIHSYSTAKQLAGHVALKALAITISTPFLSASLVESVQSDIASDKPGVLDCVKEGFTRLAGMGTPQTTRLLPMYLLVPPTIIHGLSKYLITSFVQYSYLAVVRRGLKSKRDSGDGLQPRSMLDAFFPELVASFLGNLTADCILYPLETVLARLHIQGTRTIIDNTDLGHGVIPVSTKYEGMMQCFRAIQEGEGVEGLFKGFGALILQYALHAAILKVTHVIFIRICEELAAREHDSHESQE
ncbi:mitochondrial outer membrane protein SLC25A46-like [Apostichopus japonicus]|uniref:mitochondrial outer membrane protein SLC25A46-like n=1 Tax=Stichopus japonicus TaxID=307972 RepID=UPI003AB8D1EA